MDVLQGRLESVENYYKGLFTALKDCITGLADMCTGLGKYIGAAAVYGACGEEDVPDWAKKCYNETNEKVLAVLKDPAMIGEAIAQGVSDGLDQKGTAYCRGYVGGVIVTSVAADKGLGKLGEMAKGAKVLWGTDDVAKAAGNAENVGKIDDMVTVSSEASKVAGAEREMQTSSSIKFVYEHNPSFNPKVLQDAIEDPSAVYGYKPNDKGSLKKFAKKDWSNEKLVNTYRENRIKYHEENDINCEIANKMRVEGKSDSEVARALVERRNTNRLASYIDENGDIKDLDLYMQALEHCKTYEQLKMSKTDLEIIESSTRGNPGMDASCGLYDRYYDTYNLKE